MGQSHEGVSRTVATERSKMHYLEAGPADGVPVVLIHGNASSSRFFKDLLGALPPGLRGLAPDLRGYGDSEPAPVDATRGMRDFSDDVAAFIRALGLTAKGRRVGVLGWSLGAGVAMQLAIDHPEWIGGLVLESPVSPFGFGGTKDANGTPCWPDFAGSGGGAVNAEFVKRLAAKDRSAESQLSPRNVMNGFYFKPPFRSPDEEEFLTALLAMRTGEDFYPGDVVPSPNWPGMAPGTRGINNAFSPKYMNLSAFADIRPRPDVLWIRGTDDLIVSDASMLDLGTLGRMGFVPGWPGEAVFPPQPMVAQMRAVLDRYRQKGASYREEVLSACGHSPHLEHPAAFRELVFPFWLERLRS